MEMTFEQKRSAPPQRVPKFPSFLGMQDDELHSLSVHAKLQSFPRNSSPVRIHSRCQLTGRSRAYVRRFGLSRIAFRENALQGNIPGVRKASW